MRLRVVPLLLVLVAGPLHAQGLRGRIGELFIFGSGDQPLFLAGTADPNNPASVQVHGNHFVPSAVAGNGAIIAFVTNAISENVADFPFSAASSGTTFRFEGGVPVATSTSPGPIFAERAQTLGRGRVLVGASYNTFHYRTLRGVDLDNIELVFTHANVDTPACDSTIGADCAPMGVPVLENDIMPFTLSLDLDVRVASFVVTYGLSDRLDVGVAVPIVSTSLRGSSEAHIIPFGGPTAAHFFAGTTTSPVLDASRTVEGSASGLGDVALRVKLNLQHGDRASLAVLADGRFPTGSEDDLLGAGQFSGRAVGILSARFGLFAPHANLGYLYRAGGDRNDAVIATVGFDHMLAPSVTLAMDVVSQLQVGDNKFLLPESIRFDQPFQRTVRTSSIPNSRDDLVNASIGFKFVTRGAPIVVVNSLWPLNRGGLRSNVVWTTGLEYNF